MCIVACVSLVVFTFTRHHQFYVFHVKRPLVYTFDALCSPATATTGKLWLIRVVTGEWDIEYGITFIRTANQSTLTASLILRS